MRLKSYLPVYVVAVALCMQSAWLPAQEPDAPQQDRSEERVDDSAREADRASGDDGERVRDGFGRRGGGNGGPRFFFGGPRQEERKLVAKFDTDKTGWLNAEERAAARKEIAAEPRERGPFGGGFGGPGGPGGPGFRDRRDEDEPGSPAEDRRRGRRVRFFGPGPRRDMGPAQPGEQVSPADVANYPDADLYDPTVLRMLFLEFENKDWEQELSDFHNSDVEVPAKLIVDGKEYPNVGIHFRGMSSYMGIPEGYKKSLNLSIDFVNEDKRLYGYRTLNLLNGHDDDSLMSSVLYSHIARQFMPAPKANFVRVVINGEDCGVFANVQQFNKDFTKENYGTGKGARWKVRGNPGGDAGLRYFGDDIKPYRERFTIKSKDDEQAWRDLVTLCKTLEQTPPEKLQAALEPMLDIDGTLRFLALDAALVNMDGYWVRASDYSLYQDPAGRFHLIASDMNEAFRGGGGPRGFGRRMGRGGRQRGEGREPPRGFPAGSRESGEPDRRPRGREEREESDVLFGPPGFGPPEFGPPEVGPRNEGPPEFGFMPRLLGFGPFGFVPNALGPAMFGRPGGFGPPGFGGPAGGGVKLDPLVGLDNERMPLRSKLLAVPELKARYLEYVRAIAENSLDWNKLGPVVADHRALIRDAVERDTKKLSTFEAFLKATSDESVKADANEREISLRTFADKRRAYLLEQTGAQDD